VKGAGGDGVDVPEKKLKVIREWKSFLFLIAVYKSGGQEDRKLGNSKLEIRE